MAAKPTHYLLSLTLSLLSSHVYSQTGDGCYNQYTPCPELGQVRINAILHPSSGAFIGGCYCGCDYTAMYNPLSPEYCPIPKLINYNPTTLSGDCSCNCPLGSPKPTDCQLPHTFNDQKCECMCPNDPSDCLLHQIFNTHTCKCECYQLGVPGEECFDINDMSAIIPWSLVLPDCTCQCPPHSPNAADCGALGRNYDLCKCGCPMSCPGNQVMNNEMCSCACPECGVEEVLINELTCECGIVGNSINGPETTVDPYSARYCCQTMIAGFTPFYGRCWGITDEWECNERQTGMCKWDIYNCHRQRPQCFFRDYVCNANSQCCSNVCRAEGLCR